MAKKKNSKPSTETRQVQVIETDPLITHQIYDFLSRLPPCFRFAPTDDQLIIDYLRPKIANRPIPLCLIHPVNLYKFHPRTLEETHLKHPEGDEVYYFTPRDRKYVNGKRPNRGVEGIGYWKATGSDVEIKLREEIIGYTKTLVFYEGPHKTGKKTNWIMNEYRTCETRKRTSNEDMKLDDWVLCKIHEKRVRVAKMENNEEGNVNTNEEGDVNTNEEGDTNTENAITDANLLKDEDITGEEDTHVNENNSSISYQNDFTQSHQDTGLPQNSVPGKEITYEEDTCAYENYCSTFYQNDFTQPHQDMEWSQNPLLFNNYQENIPMINDIPGTSLNTFQTHYPEFYYQFVDGWEKDLTDNTFDWSPAWVNSYNFQNSNNGLNVNCPGNFQDSSGLNVQGFINYQDSSSGFNIMDSIQDDLDDGKQKQRLDQ